MYNKKLNPLLKLLVLIFFFLSINASSRRYTQKFQETYKVKPGTEISVYNRNGSIEIKKWDKDEVSVVALKGTNWGKSELDKVKIEVNMNGNMEIRTEFLKKRAKVSVNYEIKVPEVVMVSQIESSNGSIELEGTKGPSKLKTSNGSIEVEETTGNIEAETSNGKIKVKNVDGFVSARTSNGAINIKGSGGLRKAKTSNGKIEVEIPEIKGDEVEIETSNGSIDLYVSPELNADIEMDTSNGKIEIHNVELTVEKLQKTYVKGKLGKGGKKIIVGTSNGSIDLYKLR